MSTKFLTGRLIADKLNEPLLDFYDDHFFKTKAQLLYQESFDNQSHLPIDISYLNKYNNNDFIIDNDIVRKN